MKECIEKIKENYDPIFICTDLSNRTINILELENVIKNELKIKQSSGIEINQSKEMLKELLSYDHFNKEKIITLKEKFKNDMEYQSDNNEEYIKQLFLKGKLIQDFYKKENEKEKQIILIFGNESRGISRYIREMSHYHVKIPHFGYEDTSYNLSVTCGMFLFYLYSINILPGSFLDITKEQGMEILAKNLLNNFKSLSREKLKTLELEDILIDF